MHDSGNFKTKEAERAVHWYSMVLGEANVLTKLKIEKRMSELGTPLPPQGSQPTARWTFDVDARDVIGKMHGVLSGNPTFAGGRMHMKPGDRMAATLPFDVSERTLEIWSYVKMADPRDRHIIVIRETDESGLHDVPNGNWDGIMFGGAARRIYPGSDFNHRSKKFNIPTESSGLSDLLHLAAVYARDNTITFYRNGQDPGKSVSAQKSATPATTSSPTARADRPSSSAATSTSTSRKLASTPARFPPRKSPRRIGRSRSNGNWRQPHGIALEFRGFGLFFA